MSQNGIQYVSMPNGGTNSARQPNVYKFATPTLVTDTVRYDSYSISSYNSNSNNNGASKSTPPAIPKRTTQSPTRGSKENYECIAVSGAPQYYGWIKNSV